LLKFATKSKGPKGYNERIRGHRALPAQKLATIPAKCLGKKAPMFRWACHASAPNAKADGQWLGPTVRLERVVGETLHERVAA